jgi:hypothetical protein
LNTLLPKESREVVLSPKKVIAIYYLTQDNAIATLKKWVGCDCKQKTDILSDRQFNQTFKNGF